MDIHLPNHSLMHSNMNSSPGNYDMESSVGFGSTSNLDTSFELMSASQLRDQLRREQGKRREKEAEVDILKRATGSTSLYGGSNTPKSSSPIHSRLYGDLIPSNSQDSDSGISHSGSRKSPYHHMSPPQASASLPHLSNHHQHHSLYGGGGQSSTTPLPRSLRASPIMPTYSSLQGAPPALSPGGGGGSIHEEYVSTSPSSMKNMKDAMYESEQRRLALVEKLREAHETLQNQTEKLCGNESMLSDTHHTISNLSATNEAMQKRISDLQKERDNSVTSKMDSVRQQGLLQQRVGELETELKSLRVAHSNLQSDVRKREALVDQTSRAVVLLEEENKTFQQTKQTMLKEALALKESIMIAKAKNEKLESEVIELEKLNESREMLAARNTELNAYLIDERRQVAEMHHQLDLLKGDFIKASEERDVFQSRVIELDDKCSDLNARCVSSAASKERLMQEKLDLQQGLNQTMRDKEDIIKVKQDIDSALTQAQLEVTQHRLMVEKKEEELEKLDEELGATKKVSEVLSTELSLVKSNQEKLQEELKQLNADKRAVAQQQVYWEGEARRIGGERDTLTKAMEQLRSDFLREKEQFEEQIGSHRESAREARSEKTKASARVQELETMLQRANDDLREAATKQQEETAEWKASCDRLASNLATKESEAASLKENAREANDQISSLRAELQSLETTLEDLRRYKETADELEEENKRLAREHGEDQQVIQLLEMQKTILSKNQTTGVPKQAAEKLQAEIDHLKAELGLAEDKITELKEELARERNPGGYRSARATPVAFDRGPDQDDHIKNLKEMNRLFQEKIGKLEANALQLSLRAKVADDAEVKCRDLEDQNRSLNDLNHMLGDKVSVLEKENTHLKANMPREEWVPRFNYDTIEKDKIKLEADYEIVKAEYAELEARHQKFLQDHLSRTLDSSGLPLTLSNLDRRDEFNELRKLRQENDSLERQVEVLKGQSAMSDSGKKRAEDRMRQIEAELTELQGNVAKEREKNRYIADLEIETLLRSQLDEHKQLIRQLQNEVATKNVALETSGATLDNKLAEKARELDRVARERDEHSEARRRLEQEKVVLEIKVQELKLLLEQLRDEKPRLMQEKHEELGGLRDQIMSANKNVKKLESEVRNLEEQLSDKDQELRKLQLRQSSELDGMQEEATRQIKELQLQLLQKENEGSGLRQELGHKEEELRQVRQGKTKQELELDQIRGEAGRTVEHLTSHVEKQEGEISRLKEELDVKTEELWNLKSMQEAKNEVEQELMGVRNELARVNGTIKIKETQLQDQSSQLRESQDKYDALTKEKNELRHRLEAQYDNKDEEVRDLKNKLDYAKNELTILQDMNRAMEGKSEDSNLKVRRFEDKVKGLQEEIGNLNRLVNNLQNRNKRLEESKESLTKDMDHLREEKSRCAKCNRLEGQYQELLTEKETLEEDNEELHKEVENLNSLLTLKEKDLKETQRKAKESPTKRAVTPSLDRTGQSSSRASPLTSPAISPKPGMGRSATPQQLAAALKRLSIKPGSQAAGGGSTSGGSGGEGDDRSRLSPIPKGERKPSVKDLVKGAGYDDTRRTSLNNMEARLQALRSSQDKTLKNIKKPTEKQETPQASGAASGDAGKKQARFVLPSSKKFEKSLGSTGGSSRSKPPMDDEV